MSPGYNPRPAFELDRAAVLAATALHFAILFVPITQLEIQSAMYFAGIPVGIVAGLLTPRYGEAMNNGVAACLLGGLAVVVASLIYGSYVSWRVGFGIDSLLAGFYGFFGFWTVLAVPFHAAAAAVVAILAQKGRFRFTTG